MGMWPSLISDNRKVGNNVVVVSKCNEFDCRSVSRNTCVFTECLQKYLNSPYLLIL